MKSRLFCVGAEVEPAPDGPHRGEFMLAHLNLYTGADEAREALARVEETLQQDGYRVSFIRGCWVVDADCNDGFCPVDQLPTEVSGELLFNNAVHYGEFRDRVEESDYEY